MLCYDEESFSNLSYKLFGEYLQGETEKLNQNLADSNSENNELQMQLSKKDSEIDFFDEIDTLFASMCNVYECFKF